MTIGEFWNKIKKSWIVSAGVTALIGLVLLLFPKGSLLSVCYCLGGLTIAMGVIRVVRYFKQDHFYPYLFQSDLVTGLLTVGLGLFMVSSPVAVMSLLPHLLGILLVGCGVGNILRAIDAKKAGFAPWGVLLGIAILSVLLGGLVLSNPFGAVEAVMAVMGGSMIYQGVTDLLTTFVLNKKVKDWKSLKDAALNKTAQETKAE